MPTFKELLEKVTDPELKASMLEEFDKVNTQNGERGRKLIEKDGELNTLKNKDKSGGEWASAYKLLEEKGMSPKDIPKVLEKLDYTKTVEDEYKLTSALLKDESAKRITAEKKIKDYETRTAIDKVFTEVRKNFKSEKGEPLVVVDDFIDEGKLYAELSDTNNKVLIEQRATEVLKDGLQKQEAIKTKMGFQGAVTHPVLEGQGDVGGGSNTVSELKQIFDKEGPVAAISEYLNRKK